MPHLTHAHTHLTPKKEVSGNKKNKLTPRKVSHQRGLSFFSFFSFVSVCPHPRPSPSPSRSQASGSCATGTSAHPLTGTCRPCRMYMWAAHGARSPGPPPAWSLYLGCMYNEAPPLGGTRAAWLLLGRRAWLASSAPPSYLIPPAATAVVPHKFLFFRLLRLFLSLPFLCARVDEQLHASNHARRCEWTRDRAAEPISTIPDFIAAQAAQPQPYPPSVDRVFSFFLAAFAKLCFPQKQPPPSSLVGQLGIPAVPPADLRIEAISWPQPAPHLFPLLHHRHRHFLRVESNPIDCRAVPQPPSPSRHNLNPTATIINHVHVFASWHGGCASRQCSPERAA